MRSGLLRFGVLLLLVVVFESVDAARNCRNRNVYAEARGRDSTAVFPQQPCRGTNTQVAEEYWTTVGFDGQLRDGRTTDDFLKFPVDQNNEHQLDNAFVGYWITRSKYGEGRHYEAFGHVFIKPDGRVCGWFVGMNHEIVEVCGGFRVLSRNRRNPYEPIPFEWVQGEHLRNRDTLGFHHHRIAKYAQNPQDVFFGDAQVQGKKFQGISPTSEQFVEITNPSDFTTRVWLLKKKNVVIPHQQLPPQNLVVGSQENRQPIDPRTYDDPHEHANIASSARNYPYYDQYGRPSNQRIDAERAAFDGYGRRIPFQTYEPAPSRGDSDYDDWLRRQYALRRGDAAAPPQNYDEQPSVTGVQYQPASPAGAQNEPAPSQSDPGYNDWLQRQYALRRGDAAAPPATYTQAGGSQEAQYQPASSTGAQNEPAPSQSDPGYNDWLQRQYALRAGDAAAQQQAQNEPAPSRSDPGYEDWLRRQYALRGQQPRGQQSQSQPQYANNYGDAGNAGSSSGAQNQPEAREWPNSYPGYGPAAPGAAQNQDGSSWDSESQQNGASGEAGSSSAGAQNEPAPGGGGGYDELDDLRRTPDDSGAQYYWPSGERKPYPAASQGAARGYPQQQESSQAARVPDAQNLQDASEIHRPSEEENRYKNVDIYGRPIQTEGVVRLARVKPQIIVRDRAGRTYRPWTDPSTGHITYIAESPTGDDRNVELPSSVNSDIERQLEAERRRQLENRLRDQIGQGETQTRRGEQEDSSPITAAEQARRPTFHRRRRHAKTSNFF